MARPIIDSLFEVFFIGFFGLSVSNCHIKLLIIVADNIHPGFFKVEIMFTKLL